MYNLKCRGRRSSAPTKAIIKSREEDIQYLGAEDFKYSVGAEKFNI